MSAFVFGLYILSCAKTLYMPAPIDPCQFLFIHISLQDMFVTACSSTSTRDFKMFMDLMWLLMSYELFSSEHV